MCLEDNRKYSAPADVLESEEGLGLTGDDIKIGKKVIWHYRRLPYDAEILEVYGKNDYIRDCIGMKRTGTQSLAVFT